MCMCMCPFAQDLSILATDPGVNICPKKSETVYRPIWAFWNCLACSTRKSPLHTDQIIRRNWPRYMYLWNSLVRRAPLFSSLCVYTACLCCDWWGVWPGQGTLLGFCNHSGSTKPHMSPNHCNTSVDPWLFSPTDWHSSIQPNQYPIWIFSVPCNACNIF